jgi:predicted dehydrogenase
MEWMNTSHKIYLTFNRVQSLNWYREPLYLELLDFTSAMLEKRKPTVSGEEGLQALRVCEAALESAETGQAVVIKRKN